MTIRRREAEELRPVKPAFEDDIVPAPQTEETKVTKDDKLRATDEVKTEIEKKTTAAKTPKKYVFPPMKLLKSGGTSAYYKNDKNRKWIKL